jgi:hypothetical protein
MKIEVPLFVTLPRKTKADRKCIINLNEYRNWHYIVSNQIKERYKEMVESKIKGIKFVGRVKLHFVLYQGSNRRVDRANVLSIHEKFFCDALTACGCLTDDNDNFIEETRYTSGQVDKFNPRVEIIIT